MPWIPESEMADIHIIRQDYAMALAAWKEDPTVPNAAALGEVTQRRARAIRMINREDGRFNVRYLASMFRCNKQVIREALAEEPQ